jgi:HAE1 family hydrophobic/amphiphilic exporter-1
MWLTRLCIRYPVFATMMMMAFMVLGLFAWRELSVEEYPNVEFPYAIITTDYPGASPGVVESDVTRRIEDAINTVPGVKRIISTSFEGRSRIAVEFVLGVPIEVAVQDVRDKIAAVKVRFRPEVKEPLVERFRPDEAPVFSLAFVTDSLSVRALSTHVTQQVVRKLQNIPGVGRVDVVGAMPREIQIELMPDRMESLGVGVDEVMAALRSENAQLPAGSVEVGTSEKTVEIAARVESPEAFGNLIVAQRGQSAVTLGQVARIIDGEQELQSLALLNGRRAISIDVIKMSGANTIALVDALKAQVPALEAGLPNGSRVMVVADSSRSIRASLHDVKKTLVEGAILAIVIVFLFLGSWRSTVITGLTLPISLLGCIFFLYVFGLTLNSMTLMALSLSIGLLIDDAIVVRENIVRHAAMGKSHGQAAVDGTREIGLAVLATTFTIVAVFLPVAFMGGIIGRFFYQFGIAVSCAVLLSMLVSFTLDPMLSSRWRDPDAHGMRGDSWLAGQLRAFQGVLDRLAERYAQVILWALNNRRFTLGLATGSLAVALLVAQFVGKEFVPEPDLSEISIKFSTPVGSTLAYTEQKTAQVAALVRRYPGVLDTYGTINTGMDIGKHKASLRVLLKPKRERALSQKELINAFREQLRAVSGIEVNSVAPAKETIGSLKPIQISLQGNDMQVLQRLAAEFERKLGGVSGLIDLESSLKASRPTLSLQIDRERAADLGLSVGRIGSALRPLIAGETVTTWQAADGENYNVRVRLPEALRQSAGDVAALPVASGRINPATGQPEMITIGQVASIREGISAAQINRRNLFREVLFSGNVIGRPAGDVGADIEKVAAGIVMPAGYRIVTQGANNDMKESVGYAVTALVLGALFIYMLLGAQFNSFLHPLTIMTALPLSLVGVFVALFVCRSSMNMFSIIGIVMLMGLVTKNAILLVDFIQELIHGGLPREKAILVAGKTRLRPILMTTAAMIAGMIPLALGLGEGAEQRAPMAHALIGGLLTSTVLTLVVVPVVYTCIDDMVIAFPRLAYILRRPGRLLPGTGKTAP